MAYVFDWLPGQNKQGYRDPATGSMFDMFWNHLGGPNPNGAPPPAASQAAAGTNQPQNYVPQGTPTMTPGQAQGGTKRILVQFRQAAGPTAISGVSTFLKGAQAEQMGAGMVAFTVPAAMADQYVAQLGGNPEIAAASAEGGQTAVTQTTSAGPNVAAPILSGAGIPAAGAPGFNSPINWNEPGQKPFNLWDWWNQKYGAEKKQVAKPWQVNPAVWDSLGQTGQQLALSFAEDEGYDANDYVRQINATRPIGQAPGSVLTQFAAPRSTRR